MVTNHIINSLIYKLYFEALNNIGNSRRIIDGQRDMINHGIPMDDDIINYVLAAIVKLETTWSTIPSNMAQMIKQKISLIYGRAHYPVKTALHQIVKEHFGSSTAATKAPAVAKTHLVTSRSYVSIIDAYCALRHIPNTMKAYHEFKEIRESERQRAELKRSLQQPPSLPSSTPGELSAHLTPSEATPERFWKVPRKTLSSILQLLSLTSTALQPSRDFLVNECLTSDRIQHHWKRKYHGWQTKHEKELKRFEDAIRMLQMHESKSNNKKKPSVIRKNGGGKAKEAEIEKLVTAARKIKQELQSGIEIRVGLDGPFAMLYEGLKKGWVDRIEEMVAETLENQATADSGFGESRLAKAVGTGFDRGEALMELEDMMDSLEALEEKLVWEELNRLGLKARGKKVRRANENKASAGEDGDLDEDSDLKEVLEGKEVDGGSK
jgi:hypothetical protein